jgi:hypothetical protein
MGHPIRLRPTARRCRHSMPTPATPEFSARPIERWKRFKRFQHGLCDLSFSQNPQKYHIAGLNMPGEDFYRSL